MKGRLNMKMFDAIKKDPLYERRFNSDRMDVNIFGYSFFGTYYLRVKRPNLKRKYEIVNGMDANHLVATLFDISILGYSIQRVTNYSHVFTDIGMVWSISIDVKKNKDMSTNITANVIEQVYSWVKE